MSQDRISLKWGTLKSWHIDTPGARQLLQRYHELGSSISAMAQRDTAEQKSLLCEMIDASDCETIHLDWDDKDVSKDEAKRYIRNYGATS